jgi:hypothetical protein
MGSALICAPLAVHDATLADFALDRSLVTALRMAALKIVLVTDWRSSPHSTAYLVDLNVVVDELGGCVQSGGVCARRLDGACPCRAVSQ